MTDIAVTEASASTVPTAGSPAPEPTESASADHTDASEASAVLTGRRRRLDVVRTALVAAAGLGVVSVFAPWWHTTLPGGTMILYGDDGRPDTVMLRGGELNFLGVDGGQLPRAILVLALAVAVWWAASKLWWFVGLSPLWLANPKLPFAPPSVAPDSVAVKNSVPAEGTTELWGMSLNRLSFWVVLALIVATGAMCAYVRAAQRRLDRAEGRPTGVWETKVLPKLADVAAAVSAAEKPAASKAAKK